MSESQDSPVSECPKCGAKLQRWQTPFDSSWGGEIQLVCFNDDCPYYTGGWQHMMERQAVRASYRLMVNPKSGSTSPLPVWSPDAHKDAIVD